MSDDQNNVQRDYQAIATKEIELRNAKAEYLVTGALWLKSTRKRLGFTLSKMSAVTALSISYLSEIEHGRRPLPPMLFTKLRLLDKEKP